MSSSPKAISGKRGIFWDIDGTLFSSEPIIHHCYRLVFERMRAKNGRPERVPDLEEIIAQVGKPVRTIFENLTPELSEEERSDLSLQILHCLVTEITMGKGHHYEGVAETLSALHRRGYSFFAASNGRFPYIEAILRANGTIRLFQDVSAIDNRTIHTKDELVSSVMEHSGLAPEELILVGDRDSDRKAAASNGIDFVACRYGHGDESEWGGSVARIDRIEDLLSLLSPAAG